ncbi:hypothetical protein OQJ19_09465 [Fluoribacter gormanii]|uniref:Uncharacterized protein n=1 Tax=Fluoribacter gormanii TaxID=464 RepID=A0A377GME2_9GAMM|nr:hypothetical protein [Fluoribacter gormanii]KTD05073.1 hypothetical protein Lgor_0704 [Fluoribacter gormanii]MCW8445627.1 hypothetical protein [Fluoribacter gormanii]MCW8470878.1 hypothetical protein [Fluoribacter gormanii]SIQ97907.1 hypothetical protein SAMN05421777_10526 [Fluoribacter gormanii]STO25999.1 Uncharacterised protein [Fluoribacter gormanii]
MSSVLATLGIIDKLPYTSMSQLSINSDLSKLQLESQNYFTIAKGAYAADGNVLGVTIKEGQHFRVNSSNHIEFLKNCTALVREKSSQLKSIDQKIIGSVVFGVTASALSFLPVIGFLGWIGWGATAYFIYQRATAYTEYQESLALLVSACNWSLGEDGKKRNSKVSNLTTNESIRDMMAVLYPVLTEKQVKHLIADDIEDEFAQELQEYEKKFQLGFEPNRFFSKKDDTIALSKKGAEFSRCIYGYNKGGFSDFLDAIVSILPDLYRAALHGCQKLQYWWQEKGHSPETEEAHDSQAAVTLSNK